MNMHTAKWRLATLWLVGVAIVAVILVAQSVLDVYGARAGDAWGWFLPTVMPTLSLIVGALAADYRVGATPAPQLVERGAFRTACGVSAFYLVAVALSVLLQPFAPMPPLELMQLSNLWLGPFQGVAALTLGMFFQKS